MDNDVSRITTKFMNCRILRDHQLVKDDLWVRNGKFLNPQQHFYTEKCNPATTVDCKGLIVAPGYIDVQINGACGVDFSFEKESIEEGMNKVAQKLVEHGTTSFCPTLVTSPKNTYSEIFRRLKSYKESANAAHVLGLHLEGPFISVQKKGAHPEEYIKDDLSCGLDCIKNMYTSDFGDQTSIVTLAPELPGALHVIRDLQEMGITVSMGHSVATLKQGEQGFRAGATFITHLFNAMLPFHHRDPGLVGLLTSWKLPKEQFIYYGLIADGVHTHPASLRIAHRTHPKGVVLVTDSISAACLPSGYYQLGQQHVEVRDGRAFVAGTDTLAGSVATMDECVRVFYNATECCVEEALEAASLHPAQLLGISDRKGTLDVGTDADFVILDDDLNVLSTYIAGRCVWETAPKLF